MAAASGRASTVRPSRELAGLEPAIAWGDIGTLGRRVRRAEVARATNAQSGASAGARERSGSTALLHDDLLALLSELKLAPEGDSGAAQDESQDCEIVDAL